MYVFLFFQAILLKIYFVNKQFFKWHSLTLSPSLKNLCYKYLHLLTTTCPDSQPTEVPGWELGEDAGFRFQAPWEGGTWSAVVTCSLFVQVSHHFICLHGKNHIWPNIWVKRPKVPFQGCLGKSEKKLLQNDQVFCLTYAFVITWVCW